jgi:hypothetical protein
VPLFITILTVATPVLDLPEKKLPEEKRSSLFVRSISDEEKAGFVTFPPGGTARRLC